MKMTSSNLKNSLRMRDLVAVLVALGVFMADVAELRAAVYLSNLENRFEGGGIGDIGGVPNNWTSVAAGFTTGAGSFKLNSVTLEFYLNTSDFPPPPYWTNAVVHLYQQRGNERLLLGSLKSPTLNPLPTQWPQPSAMFPGSYTAYVDFHPLNQTILHGSSTYVVDISDPPISSTPLALIFSGSSNYTSAGEWKMAPTVRPFETGVSFLNLAVSADAVPGESAYSAGWDYRISEGSSRPR
jgi:hypothetical protein